MDALDGLPLALANGIGVVAAVATAAANEWPWPTITAAGGGWLLFGLTAWRVIRGYQTGATITRREADTITARAEKAEQALEKALSQNAQLMDMARLGVASMQALEQAAKQ